MACLHPDLIHQRTPAENWTIDSDQRSMPAIEPALEFSTTAWIGIVRSLIAGEPSYFRRRRPDRREHRNEV